MTHFNRGGIDVLVERHGGGQPKRYTEAERERILQEARRTPDRNHDGTATWSLITLQRALRQAPDGLPTVSTYTIWCVLRDADFVWTKDQTPLRLLLVWDNLTGHYTIDLILWLFAHGIMPLFTPLGGSYLNMAESVQRILKRRALDGQHPKTPEEIMEWLEAAARGWNREPTPFEWGGKRRARRQRARARRHALGGSGAHLATTLSQTGSVNQWLSSTQATPLIGLGECSVALQEEEG